MQSTARRAPGQSRLDRFIERADERPKPPWHPVPLVELAVLVGIALIVIGLINSDTSRGRMAMLFGLALASLAGLDTAARKHFAGFRSHSSLLGGMPAVIVVASSACPARPCRRSWSRPSSSSARPSGGSATPSGAAPASGSRCDGRRSGRTVQ